MSFGDQAQARKAAGKFIETNAGPNRLIAIVNFGGSLVITQNFTNDVDRLKAIVTRHQRILDFNRSRYRSDGPTEQSRGGISGPAT